MKHISGGINYYLDIHEDKLSSAIIELGPNF